VLTTQNLLPTKVGTSIADCSGCLIGIVHLRTDSHGVCCVFLLVNCFVFFTLCPCSTSALGSTVQVEVLQSFVLVEETSNNVVTEKG
jgi:hypothetical protein